MYDQKHYKVLNQKVATWPKRFLPFFILLQTARSFTKAFT